MSILSTAAIECLRSTPDARARIIDTLTSLEPGLYDDGFNAREEVTGPLTDTLFERGEVITRTLTSGVDISCRYVSKIARDFMMGMHEPDHVWEPQTTKLLLQLAERANNIIIGGAYFGDHAVPAAHVLRDSGNVHCFEISEVQRRMLQHNAEANQLTNININDTALWSADGARISVEGDDSLAAPHESTESEDETYATTTITTYCNQHEITSVDVIMLDVEGGELDALKGAESYLNHSADKAPVLIFEVHRAYVNWDDGLEKTDIVTYLESKGYHVYALRDHQSNVDMRERPIEIIPAEKTYTEGPPHGFNMVAFKDEDIISRHDLVVCHDVSPKLLFHRDPALHQPLH